MLHDANDESIHSDMGMRKENGEKVTEHIESLVAYRFIKWSTQLRLPLSCTVKGAKKVLNV